MYGDPGKRDQTGITTKGTFKIYGCGRVRKWVKYGDKVTKVTFEDALHALDLDHNLISIGSLISHREVELRNISLTCRGPSHGHVKNLKQVDS